MRLKYILLALVILNQIAYSKDSPLVKNGDQLNVWAIEGLALKEQPSFSGKSILVIAYGQTVKIIDDRLSMPASLSIKNNDFLKELKGNWIKVSYKGTQGYVFDAYLSKMPLFLRGMESEEDYFKRNYGILRISNVKRKNGYEKIITYYKNGNIYKSTLFDGCFDIELHLKNTSYQDAVLLVEALYNDADVPMQDLKITKFKEVVKLSYSFCD